MTGSEITENWRTKDFDTYMGGFVKLGDYLYGCGTRKKDLKSFDAETGEPVDSLKAGSGATVAANNMLLLQLARGTHPFQLRKREVKEAECF